MRPCGRNQHDAGGVGKLVQLGIVLVAPADGVGQRRDLRLLAGQEMPTLGRVGVAQPLQVHSFLLAASCGVSRGSMLRVTISNCLPGTKPITFSAAVSPFKTSVQSMGHW